MKIETRGEIINSWFKDHTAHRSVLKDEHGNTVERLLWAQVGHSVYRIYYYCIYGTLVVYGDLGEAIYQWNKMDMDLRWVSNCSLEYFAGKCQASEEGRGYKVWNPDRARERLDEIGHDNSAYDALDSEHEWSAWMGHNGYDTFGDCYIEYGSIGMEISMRCEAHLLGLKQAFARTDKEKE